MLASALAIFGFVDVPIVYLSIRYFRTQHPQPVIGGGQGSGIDPVMMNTLLINFLAFVVFGSLLTWLRYRLQRMEQQIVEAQALEGLMEPEHRVTRAS